LGIWMSVQSAVECRHQEWWRDPDGLAISVQEAWQHLPEDTIHRVFERIPIVLQMIVECGGDNVNVKERRGRHGVVVVAARLPEWIKKYERSKFSQGRNVRSGQRHSQVWVWQY
jgi:hypothetical protein